MNDLV